jgi:phosphoglycerate dehydrogenase-like enzyme
MALLLNLTRDLKSFNERMPDGWNNQPRLPMIELRGKTMLIIGLGGIGNQVAERAAGFGMTVLATDPKDIPYSNAVEYAGKPDELHALLPKADVVVVCAPRTPATEGMLSTDEFAAMKDGVYIVSVSRGAIIDTDALVAALESGKVRAAGLDVTHPEPLPTGHPLWTMPNVTITPHMAHASDGIEARQIELFRDNIRRFVKGLPLRHVVDKEAGF